MICMCGTDSRGRRMVKVNAPGSPLVLAEVADDRDGPRCHVARFDVSVIPAAPEGSVVGVALSGGDVGARCQLLSEGGRIVVAKGVAEPEALAEAVRRFREKGKPQTALCDVTDHRSAALELARERGATTASMDDVVIELAHDR